MISKKKCSRALRYILYVAGVILFLGSCQKEMDKYYEVPGWLKGNAWEILEAKGNYSLFLAGVEETGFKDLVNGTGIVTVMAPNDEVFQKYLTSKGYSSIDAMPITELTKLISYHLVYYSFSKDMFVNYQPDGVETDDTGQKGLFYKYRTKSKDVNSLTSDYANNYIIRQVYHKERFLPVFSYELFATMGIDAKSNYEYFYPNSTWTGGTDGFNVSNASVIDYAIITSNGFIYTVDKVIEPLETIYTELDNSADFTTFKNVYDRFAYYYYDAATSANYGDGDSLFIKFHKYLPQIASEWTYNGEGTLPDYANLGQLAAKAYNVFAPNDPAMKNFFDSFWGKYYTSINDVNFLPLAYLLYNHVYQGNVVFPETIEKGLIKSSFGTTIKFDRNTAVLKKMCLNGTLYGLDHVMIPGMFTSVTGPVFQDPKYNMFLIMMNGASLVEPLMTDQATFKLFLPSNDMITDYTRVRNGDNKSADIRYVNLNPKLAGSDEIQVATLEDYGTMSTTLMDGFVRNHVTKGIIAQSGNNVVYKTLNPYNYLYVRNDTIYSSGILNSNSQGPKFNLITGTRSNGETYELTGDVSALVPEYNLFKELMLRSPLLCPAEFAQFREKVIQKASLDITVPPFSFLQGERFIVFIPSNALQTEMAAITAAKAAENAKYHFVNVSASKLNDYPFPGAGIAGELTTFKAAADGSMMKLTLIDTGSGLKVRDYMGNEVNVIGYFPHIYSDGAAYLIDGLLKYE
jgi:uncharacterized surface protein with fasciclin (FAS1) repeats